MPITVNMGKAISITKDRLRAERAPLLEQLDVAFMRAVEAGDAKAQAQIAKDKQKLRDVTKLADGCSTLEELKSICVEAAQ